MSIESRSWYARRAFMALVVSNDIEQGKLDLIETIRDMTTKGLYPDLRGLAQEVVELYRETVEDAGGVPDDWMAQAIEDDYVQYAERHEIFLATVEEVGRSTMRSNLQGFLLFCNEFGYDARAVAHPDVMASYESIDAPVNDELVAKFHKQCADAAWETFNHELFGDPPDK